MDIPQWIAYLEVFDSITIHVRIDESKKIDDGYVLEHPRIRFVPIPFYNGALGFLTKYFSLKSYIYGQIKDPNNFYAMWLPSQLGALVFKATKRIGAPLMVSVIGDTEDVSKTILPKPINSIVAFFSKRVTQKIILNSDAVSYVTTKTLQKKYPACPSAITLARSDVKLPTVPQKKDIASYFFRTGSKRISVIAVGSQQQNYKGHDLLIEAMSLLNNKKIPIQLTIVGQGILHEKLVSQAKELSLNNITFIKSLGSTEMVAKELQRHDVYIMPSRTEGMPKALLEALDAGVFSLGSRVGGIPEILPSNCIFEPNSASTIAEKLKYYYQNPREMEVQLKKQQEMISNFRNNHTGNAILQKFLLTWIANSVLREERK